MNIRNHVKYTQFTYKSKNQIMKNINSHLNTSLINHLVTLGAEKIEHVNSDLLQHLTETYKLLLLWENDEHITSAGLYHSIYGTSGFPIQLVSLERRKEMAAIIGEKAEALLYLYGACDRSFTYPKFLEGETKFYKDRFTGEIFLPPNHLFSGFCEITFANEMEIIARTKYFPPDFVALFMGMSKYVSKDAYQYFITLSNSAKIIKPSFISKIHSIIHKINGSG